MVYDDDELDGCGLDFTDEVVPDHELELFPLFARALDPNDSETIEDVERRWNGVSDRDS